MDLDDRAAIGSSLAHIGNYLGDVQAYFTGMSTELTDHLKYLQEQVQAVEAMFWEASR
jgi:hypothetical protein